MHKILIAVDETEASVRAAETARDLFGPDAEYLAVNVATYDVPWTMGYGYAYVWPYTSFPAPAGVGMAGVGPAPTGPADPDTRLGAQRRDVAEAVAREAADDAGLHDATPVAEVGDPGEAIVLAADSHDVDVIVVGSHDRNWLSRLFHHSVSNEVVRTAGRPVLVVS